MARASTSATIAGAVRATRASGRRKQLLDAAVSVMERTGFHQMSMQALADEAEVSVGLIYKYFDSKEQILLEAIVGILESMGEKIAPAMEAAGDDPVDRLAAGFSTYIRIIDTYRDTVTLTYRESRTLDADGRRRIMDLEIATAQPLRMAIEDGIARGLMNDVDVDLMVYDMVMLAHSWALKHWHFGTLYTLEVYIRKQMRFAFNNLLAESARDTYRHHFHLEKQ